MFEAAILILLATGSLWMLSRLNPNTTKLAPLDDKWDEQLLTVIAGGGLYSIHKAGETPSLTAFSDLQLINDGLTLRDGRDGQSRMIQFAVVQWVSAISLNDDGTTQISIHVESNHQWRILELRLVESDMVLLKKVLRRVLPSARLNIDKPNLKPIGLIPARMVDENLQGEITLGAEVSLYLLPHMLIVIKNDKVQAKLDTSSIRRVLSVERISSKLDGFLNRNTPDGIVRLYSLYETAVFALPQYNELAEEISYLSRCPVEFIVQEDKTNKS